MSRVESYHFSLGLNNHLPVPTGLCWILGLAFKACGELPAPCSPPGLPQTLPQTSPLLTPKDCFTAPALPLAQYPCFWCLSLLASWTLTLVLRSKPSSCVADSASLPPWHHKLSLLYNCIPCFLHCCLCSACLLEDNLRVVRV